MTGSHYGEPDDDGVILQEPKDPPPPARWTATDCFSDCAKVLWSVIIDWSIWHAQRAQARAITGACVLALDALIEAADAMAEGIYLDQKRQCIV